MIEKTSGYFQRLLKYAESEAHQERVRAVIRHGGNKAAAAKSLGISRNAIRQTITIVEARAARRGFAPSVDVDVDIPDGFGMKGFSNYYNKQTGEITGQWVKGDLDREQQLRIMQQVVESLSASIKRVKPIKAPTDFVDELTNTVIVTDYHLGMLSWPAETGHDWNIEIATSTLIKLFQYVLAEAPKAKKMVIMQGGDFLHFDSIIAAVTPTSGHHLDSDSRFAKIVDAAITVLRAVIDMCLATHEEVHVILAEGNHDLTSSLWLRKMFKVLYENEPRVTIDDSEIPFYVHQHGDVMLAFTHGHKSRKPALPSFFAAKYPEIWGATKKRYVFCGHEHHEDSKQYPGMLVVQEPTIAPPDAYSTRSGYVSEREARCYTFHKEWGRWKVFTVVPEMLI